MMSFATIHSFAQTENMNGTITMSEYDFMAPDKWQLQKNHDHLLIQNMESGCLIRILEPRHSYIS